MLGVSLAEQILLRFLGVCLYTVVVNAIFKNIDGVEMTWGMAFGPVLFVGVVLSEITFFIISRLERTETERSR